MPKSIAEQQHEALPHHIGIVVDDLTRTRDRVLEDVASDIAMTQRSRTTGQAVAIEEKLSEVSSIELRIEQLKRLPARVKSEPEIYRRGDAETSYFRDIYRSWVHGDSTAKGRLTRNARMQAEKRAVDLNTSAGTGLEFAPPRWVVEDWIKLARPGRVTADLIGAQPLPAGISSINIPKVATGAGTAVQTTQGNPAQDTAATTSSVTSSILTVAGFNTVSQQLVDQSGIPVDQFILKELALSYAASLNSQVLTAAAAAPWPGGGLLNVSGAGSVTYTDASPAVYGAGKFYSNLLKALSTLAVNRDLPATAIVLHPRRWLWLAAGFDSSNRPGVLPKGNASLHIAGQSDLAGYGSTVPVGDVAGVPVYVDSSIPTNLGAGSNQDAVVVLRESDIPFYERPLEAMSFEATFAPNLEILFRAVGFAALLANAQSASICTVQGTGLVTPVIA